jgi:DNA-binding MarR family transcriptional regulator
MRRLQQIVGLYGVSSARRVNDIVGRLKRAGFVVARATPSDKRARILEPTAKLIAHDLDWLRAHYAPLDVLFPRPGYEQPLRRDPAYRKAHRIIGSQMAAHGAKIMDMSPAVMLFMNRDAGIMILFKLMERALEETGAGASHLTLVDIGDRFGVTRTHVRKVLRDAEAAGLVEARGRQFSPTQSLRAGFDRFFAETASGHDLMHRLALRLVER